ncbi:MAG: peptide deformylase [Candidatus Pacebacteria bacterium]|nr:peptide deformylase [Candidatus Paceibacterota bacterium]
MPQRPILQDGIPSLREIAQAVPEELFGTDELAVMINDMADSLDSQPDGVAIAAPQIGIPYRIFLVRYDRTVPPPPEGAPVEELEPDIGVYINPEFVRTSRRRDEMDEGCLSVRGVYGTTLRHERATVRARDASGASFERGGGGLLAQIFQHETDHLDGILFIDHAIHIAPSKIKTPEVFNPLSFVFFGTPSFAAIALDEFNEAGLVPELIVTAPDMPAGRGLLPTPPAVKEWAIAHDVPYIQPSTLKEVPPELLAKKFDVFVVAAYGKLLRTNILSLPTHGCVNLHPSLLPHFRGASPIESQILADAQEVGVSIMQMDEELDHGAIYAQEEMTIEGWPIGKQELTDLFAHESGRLAAAALPEIVNGQLPPVPQNHAAATYTKKIEKADGLLDCVDNLPAPTRANYLKYLAYEGWPGTYFFVQKNGRQTRVKVTRASFADDCFTVERVIPEGRNEQPFADFAKTL